VADIEVISVKITIETPTNLLTYNRLTHENKEIFDAIFLNTMLVFLVFIYSASKLKIEDYLKIIDYLKNL